MGGNLRDRRRHKRVAVVLPTTATCGTRVGQVVDASMSGMAILHHGPAAMPGETAQVELRYGQHLFQLPVTVIWDRALGAAAGRVEPAPRRCGLAFRPLGKSERYWLEHFLWSQTEGWPEIPTPDELA